MPSQTRVALVVGGHPFDVPPLLDALYATDLAVYPQDLGSLVEGGRDPTWYDAVVWYNYHGNGYAVEVTDEMREAVPETLATLGDAGVGQVVLHHGLLAFPEMAAWDELVGVEGRSAEDVHFGERVAVDVADDDHPVTDGLDGFEVTDETYEMPGPGADSRALLRTDHPGSVPELGWAREYRDARVFCYQSGHDAEAFENPEFRRVLERAIRWTASE